jgi:hypothetical protein
MADWCLLLSPAPSFPREHRVHAPLFCLCKGAGYLQLWHCTQQEDNRDPHAHLQHRDPHAHLQHLRSRHIQCSGRAPRRSGVWL